MTQTIRTLSLVIALAILAAGCGSQLDKPVITYERGSLTVPAMSTVVNNGLYTLFPETGTQPLAAAYLHAGDQFGFQKIDGAVMGVYIQSGQTTNVSLDSVLMPNYIWKYQGDKKP